jgi:hypothetical protein
MPVDSVIAVTAQLRGCSLYTDDAYFKGIEDLGALALKFVFILRLS